MRQIVFFILFIGSVNLFAEELQIHISQEQIDNLAIKVGNLTPSREVPLLSAPAEVVVPGDKELLLSAPQPGLLSRLQVNIGDTVKKNQIVAQINSPELLVLQQQFLTARSQLNLANLAHRRDKKLLQEGVIAQRRWQETQALYNSKTAIADEAKQLLRIAGMSKEEVDRLVKTHRLSMALNVRSPIDGVVLERLATVGSRLDMQAPLYRIADVSELWLNINIPQERTRDIRIGDQVHIPGTDAIAKIILLGQSVDPANQTVLARAVIESHAENLRVGQHVVANVMQHSSTAGFRVPNTAIAQNAGHSYVFVRNNDGFVVAEVAVVGKQDKDSLITAPLSEKQQIALEGAVALKANWLGMGGDE